MIEDFYREGGKLLLKNAASDAMNKNDLMRLFVHDNAVNREILRNVNAYAWGMTEPETFRRPYGETSVNNIVMPQAQPQPAKKPTGWIKPLLASAAIGSLGGAGVLGAGYYLLKDQFKQQPAIVNPADFKFKVQFDPDAADPVKLGPVEGGK